VKYLGIDFGLRRVGLAISEGELASPYKIIEGRGVKDLAQKVGKVFMDEGFDVAVVGMPEGKMGQNVKGFNKILQKSGVLIIESDETLSSQDALKEMIKQGVKREKRKLRDAFAASIILQNYLDEKS